MAFSATRSETNQVFIGCSETTKTSFYNQLSMGWQSFSLCCIFPGDAIGDSTP
uniref:Uncharacterized protein n=1 Tax=Anguilla anguilla TaxID=7936 RepID=A0A0E9UE13_ANGAN